MRMYCERSLAFPSSCTSSRVLPTGGRASPFLGCTKIWIVRMPLMWFSSRKPGQVALANSQASTRPAASARRVKWPPSASSITLTPGSSGWVVVTCRPISVSVSSVCTATATCRNDTLPSSRLASLTSIKMSLLAPSLITWADGPPPPSGTSAITWLLSSTTSPCLIAIPYLISLLKNAASGPGAGLHR